MVDAAARLTTLTRLGFASRGLLYLVIAILVLTTGRKEDPAGALEYVAQGGGKTLLLFMTLGLVAYGIWRLSDAALNVERHQSDNSGKIERVGAAASGLIHLFLGWQAVRLMQGSADVSDNGAQESAQSVLLLPGGSTALIIGSLVLLATGGVQIAKAVKASYLKHLEPAVARKDWAKWTGRLGYSARGLIFIITGFFLARAGLDDQASEAGGMADALAWLNSPWDYIIAAGLFAFGLFSLIEARYRILHDVPVETLGQRISGKF